MSLERTDPTRELNGLLLENHLNLAWDHIVTRRDEYHLDKLWVENVHTRIASKIFNTFPNHIQQHLLISHDRLLLLFQEHGQDTSKVIQSALAQFAIVIESTDTIMPENEDTIEIDSWCQVRLEYRAQLHFFQALFSMLQLDLYPPMFSSRNHGEVGDVVTHLRAALAYRPSTPHKDPHLLNLYNLRWTRCSVLLCSILSCFKLAHLLPEFSQAETSIFSTSQLSDSLMESNTEKNLRFLSPTLYKFMKTESSAIKWLFRQKTEHLLQDNKQCNKENTKSPKKSLLNSSKKKVVFKDALQFEGAHLLLNEDIFMSYVSANVWDLNSILDIVVWFLHKNLLRPWLRKLFPNLLETHLNASAPPFTPKKSNPSIFQYYSPNRKNPQDKPSATVHSNAALTIFDLESFLLLLLIERQINVANGNFTRKDKPTDGEIIFLSCFHRRASENSKINFAPPLKIEHSNFWTSVVAVFGKALPETVYFRCLRPLSNKQIDSFLNSFIRGNNIEINNAISYGLLGVYYGNLFMKSEIERSEDAEYYSKIYEKYHSENDLGKEFYEAECKKNITAFFKRKDIVKLTNDDQASVTVTPNPFDQSQDGFNSPSFIIENSISYNFEDECELPPSLSLAAEIDKLNEKAPLFVKSTPTSRRQRLMENLKSVEPKKSSRGSSDIPSFVFESPKI